MVVGAIPQSGVSPEEQRKDAGLVLGGERARFLIKE